MFLDRLLTSLVLLTINFEVLCFMKLCPIFVGPMLRNSMTHLTLVFILTKRILPVMFVGVASPECKDFENILLECTEMDSSNLPILVLNVVASLLPRVPTNCICESSILLLSPMKTLIVCQHLVDMTEKKRLQDKDTRILG